MKYGLLIQNYGKKACSMSGYNLGDGIQSFIVRKIYEYMGISKDEIQEIQLHELPNYRGDYVLLPMISMAVGIEFAELPLSPNIIPVFISTHFAISELTSIQVNYLKSYEPIGCRDEYSLNTMRKYGIQAYLSGCITTILDKTEKTASNNKVYFIDIPEKLKDYIPEELKENAVYDTHLIEIPNREMTVDEAEKYYNLSIERIKEYSKNACLMVSSRLHALVPCIAMGIPVIGVFDNISYRFSWLDKFIHLYAPEEFDSIDWNPQTIDLEEHKGILCDMFASQIKQAYEKHKKIYDVSYYYENRKKAEYCNRYVNLLKQIPYGSEDCFDYTIWGCGLIGNCVYEIMCKLYPNAKLSYAIDGYKTGKWHDVDIIKPEQASDSAFIILATYSGKNEGYALFEKRHLKEGKDFIYVATTNG